MEPESGRKVCRRVRREKCCSPAACREDGAMLYMRGMAAARRRARLKI